MDSGFTRLKCNVRLKQICVLKAVASVEKKEVSGKIEMMFAFRDV